MQMQIAGFAKGLVRCLDFDSVSAAEMESVLEARPETLELDYAEPPATAPLIESSSAFTHLVFVQHGTVAPRQSPHSELEAPFLIGVHEFLMRTDRWVGSYSAITEAAIVRIPRSVLWNLGTVGWVCATAVFSTKWKIQTAETVEGKCDLVRSVHINHLVLKLEALSQNIDRHLGDQ